MNLKPIVLLALIHGTALSSIAADPPPAGIRMFTCAHSFHAFVYRQVAEAVIADPAINELYETVCANLQKQLAQQVKKLGGA